MEPVHEDEWEQHSGEVSAELRQEYTECDADERELKARLKGAVDRA